MEIRKLTCTECPLGCQIEVSLDGKKVVLVTGNTCPRGKLYAENEVVCPKRVVTSTVKVKDGKMISVKTDNPVPKTQMFSVIKKISSIILDKYPKIYDIIIKDVVDGVNVVATDDLR